MVPALPVRTSTSKTNRVGNESLTYNQLNIDHIRVIRLKPLAFNRARNIPEAIITSNLETVDRSQKPKYSAISYAWGSGEYDQEIRIGGHRYFISLNLAEAFRHIRHETDEITLWADQLSINQKDDNEKNEQVQMMKLIYENATETIAWLGNSADDSDLFMVTLQELAKCSSVARKQSAQTISRIAQRMSGLSGVAWCEQDVISRLPYAFDKFCHRKYWKRLWVIQEFAVCNNLIVKCGTFDLQVRDFLVAWRNVERLSSKHDFHVDRLWLAFSSNAKTFVSGLVAGRRRYRNNRGALSAVMCTNLVLEEDYNHPKCSDARDRVFSLLGLADDKDDYGQFPDYTKPTEEIYEELARTSLRKGYINILSFSQFPRNLPGMPSWVPDWSMQIRIPAGGNTSFPRPPRVSRNTDQTRVLILDQRTVVLVGTFVDTVKDTGAEWNPNWLERLKSEEAMPYLKDIEKFCVSSPRIPPKEKRLASARIALADSGGEPITFWDNILEHYEAALACFARGDVLPQYYDGTSDHHRTRELIKASKYAIELNRLHSRRVIITESGYIGLAPSHVMNGDRVCIFLGADYPFVVRPGSDDSFTLVGDGFVYGIMQGEFFKKHCVLESIKLV